MNSVNIYKGEDATLTFNFFDNGLALDITTAVLTYSVNTPTPISITLTKVAPYANGVATGKVTHTMSNQAVGQYNYYTKLDDGAGNITITDTGYLVIKDPSNG